MAVLHTLISRHLQMLALWAIKKICVVSGFQDLVWDMETWYLPTSRLVVGERYSSVDDIIWFHPSRLRSHIFLAM